MIPLVFATPCYAADAEDEPEVLGPEFHFWRAAVSNADAVIHGRVLSRQVVRRGQVTVTVEILEVFAGSRPTNDELVVRNVDLNPGLGVSPGVGTEFVGSVVGDTLHPFAYSKDLSAEGFGVRTIDFSAGDLVGVIDCGGGPIGPSEVDPAVPPKPWSPPPPNTPPTPLRTVWDGPDPAVVAIRRSNSLVWTDAVAAARACTLATGLEARP